MKLFKKILKVIACIAVFLLVGLYIAFSVLTSPKSDNDILKLYKHSNVQPTITLEDFKGFKYRKIALQHDSTLPTLVFVHGTIGSVADFTKYLSDSTLQQKANMITYDRIGYNYKDTNQVQESIAFERSHLQEVIKAIPSENVVVVGYSYGGPIALSVKEKVKHTILLAPAVYSKVEPMPFAVNFYKWKATRFLVPQIWKQASKEKLSHQKDLQQFEDTWHTTQNNVVAIHGTKDWIVPLSNSVFLEEQFPKEQFELITIDGAGHELVWSHFKEIKQQLLNYL